MTENNKSQKDEWLWERTRVQRVLNYHNDKHKTYIIIKGRTTDIYTQLQGQLNWDWVCCDSETNVEIAVEVKKLTDEKLEVRQNIIWEVIEDIKNELSCKLSGEFVLYITSPKNYQLPLQGKENKQKFKDIISQAIIEKSQTLKLEDKIDLTPQITTESSLSAPNHFFFELHKSSDEGSALYQSSGVVGSWSPSLNKHELEKFIELVSHANEQLKQATNAKQTFLIIIEEGLRITTHGTVIMAFKQIDHTIYSHIDYIYYISGKEIEEIIPNTNT
jgi:hypothetical protein